MLKTSVAILQWREEKAYTRQPDRARFDVQVHEIVDHATLQVVLDAIDDDLLAHVHDLQVGQMALVLVNGLIHLLIVPDAFSEVLRSRVGVLALVVGRRGLDLKDIAHDQGLIVALRLHEQRLDALCITTFLDPAAALLGGVGCIEDADHATFLEPLQHIGDRSLGSSSTHTLALRVGVVEEVGTRLGRVLASVVAHVEDHGVDREPFQVPLSCAEVSRESGGTEEAIR
jgi:hypothetical protein